MSTDIQEATFELKTTGDDSAAVWLFQANPKRGYDLAADIQQREPGWTVSWTVTRYQNAMQAGDRCILWQGGDEAGIYAIGTLTAVPAEAEGVNPYTSGEKRKAWWRVSLRVDAILDPPLLKSELTADTVLSDLLVLRQPAGTNFRVPAEHWARLQQLLAEPTAGGGNADGLVEAIRSWYPDETVRTACVGWTADAIEAAHALGPAAWVTTLRGQMVRLNVGRNLAVELRRGCIWVGLHEPTLGETALQRIGTDFEERSSEFKLSEGCFLYLMRADRFREHADGLKDAFQRFLRISAQTAKASTWAKAHNERVVVALEQLSGRQLPRPARANEKPAVGYWKLSPERGAVLWEEWKKGGFASIGWGDLGDLTGLDREGFDERLAVAMKNNPEWTRTGAGQVWRFINIRPGSRIVANFGKRRVLGIGTVTGGYQYVEGGTEVDGDRHAHRLPVEWDDLRERAVERSGWQRTLLQLKKADFEELLEAPSPGQEPEEDLEEEEEAEPEDRLDFASLHSELGNHGLYFSEEVVATYLLALQAKRFVILSGISGTGKTKLAQEIARILQGEEASPAASDDAPDDSVTITITPAGLKYKQFTLTSALVAKTPGLMEHALETRRLTARYPGGEQSVSVTKRASANNLLVALSGDLGSWFVETFDVGDTFAVRIEPDDEGNPSVVRMVDDSATQTSVERRSAIVPVRPDWTDGRGLLGYYNPLTKQYQVTPFLDLLMRAKAEQEKAKREERAARPYFAILDEMNLARVEHYFSDFLSCMESGDALHLHDDIELEQGEAEVPVPRRLVIPRNLFFTGTVNIDETTYMFSPKVLDRAFTLEFNEVNLAAFGEERQDEDEAGESTPLRLERFDGGLAITKLEAAKQDKSKEWRRLRGLLDGQIAEAVMQINERLQPEHRHFGYRVANEIARFVNLAADQASKDEATLWAAFDVAVLSKVLPKLHGTQQELEGTLSRLFGFAVDRRSAEDAKIVDTAWELKGGTLVPKSSGDDARRPDLPRTATKLWRMLVRLRHRGFASFIE
jgi:5-methylcytosine-specific restriction enzyme B